ncbi:Holliday junction branch migration protein RuvA [Candidatus Gottesmanbacteria bacterium]|nr:Holliday junction branch migration protein RuvA [Candidatus Gottesmanbacteria bacterium]
MIGFLSGTIRDKYPNPIIVDVGGIGYVVHVPDRLITQLPVNAPCLLYIHTHVREDALDLYGFLTKAELTLFELLLTVSGIGPKTGLTIVDRGVAAIQQAVGKSDVDFFTTIPRLGRKNAQKIIIELKSKLGSVTDLDLSLEHGETKEVLDVLLTMGFAKHEAMEAIKKLSDAEVSLEQKIRRALQLLARK